MICLTCDELTKHKTQTIQKRVKQTVLDKIAPKDPTAKRPGFYVLLDKPVGGLPSNDGVGHHPVYINGDRLVTFAKMVGGIADENILEMLRTAKGFRKLVHSVGVSIVGGLPDKVVTFTLGFSGELGSGGSRNSMKITTDGTEHIMVMDEQQWSDSDETPQEFLFELVKPKDIATATVKLYLNDGYTVPEVDPDPPVAFDTPAYGEMIARSCLSTGNNIRIKRVLQQLRDGKPTTIAFLGGSITQGAGAVPSQEMCYARKTYEAICERYTPDHGAHVRYIKAGVGGTPCQLGIIRYDRDITRDGAVQPDLIIVEFAVNDDVVLQQLDTVRELGFADRFDEVKRLIAGKVKGQPEPRELLDIKAAIRRAEAKAADRSFGLDPSHVHFLNLPFYETGGLKKAPLSQRDIDIIVKLLREIEPDQIYAAGDLADPHGTHRTCMEAVLGALEVAKDDAWLKNCHLWLYRGAWLEWDLGMVDMAVPLSPDELIKKRHAIYRHVSQKDIVPFPGSDSREFWQRAEERTQNTARLYDKLGMAEYQAIEVFVKMF